MRMRKHWVIGFLLCLTGSTSWGQRVVVESLANELKGRRLVSTILIEEVSEPTGQKSEAVDSEGRRLVLQNKGKNGKSGMGVTREIAVKQKKGATALTLQIARIWQKTSAQDPPLDIDTDSPFPTGVVEKMSADHYLTFINKPLTLDIGTDGELKRLQPRPPIDGLWKNDLPLLSSVQELSGIVLAVPPDRPETWVETLQDSHGTYTHTYTLDKSDGTQQAWLLKGVLQVNERSQPEASPPQKTDQGGLVLQETIQSLDYEGFLKLYPRSNLIRSLELHVNKSEQVSLMGVGRSSTVRQHITVSNELGKAK